MLLHFFFLLYESNNNYNDNIKIITDTKIFNDEEKILQNSVIILIYYFFFKNYHSCSSSMFQQINFWFYFYLIFFFSFELFFDLRLHVILCDNCIVKITFKSTLMMDSFYLFFLNIFLAFCYIFFEDLVSEWLVIIIGYIIVNFIIDQNTFKLLP